MVQGAPAFRWMLREDGVWGGCKVGNGAKFASCCNTPTHRWGALAIRPGGPAADTMAFMHRVSGWLGRLSVGRKLMLIYLLDLTAVPMAEAPSKALANRAPPATRPAADVTTTRPRSE